MILKQNRIGKHRKMISSVSPILKLPKEKRQGSREGRKERSSLCLIQKSSEGEDSGARQVINSSFIIGSLPQAQECILQSLREGNNPSSLLTTQERRICCQELGTSSSLVKCQEMVREAGVLVWKNCRMLGGFQRLAFLIEFGWKHMTSILAAQQLPLMHQKICVPGEKNRSLWEAEWRGKEPAAPLLVYPFPVHSQICCRILDKTLHLCRCSAPHGGNVTLPSSDPADSPPRRAVTHTATAWSPEPCKSRVAAGCFQVPLKLPDSKFHNRSKYLHHHCIAFLYHLTHNSFKAYLSTVEAITTRSFP